MKPLTPALQALFETKQFVSCDLYYFALAGGGSVYLTSAELPVVTGGITYQPTPLIDRTAISQKTGLEVTSLDITLYPQASDLILGTTWLQAIKRGLLDGAAVTFSRLFGATWGNWAGVVTMLAGRVADASIGRSKAKLTINSWTEILSNQMPHNYYQSSCGRVLFDAGCGVSRAAFTNDATITANPAGPTNLAFFSTLNATDGHYSLGSVQMLSGVCAGEWRPVQASLLAHGYVQLAIPFSVAPAAGDILAAYAGCDKQMGTCQNKFNNLPRFRGFPFIPAPEMAV